MVLFLVGSASFLYWMYYIFYLTDYEHRLPAHYWITVVFFASGVFWNVQYVVRLFANFPGGVPYCQAEWNEYTFDIGGTLYLFVIILYLVLQPKAAITPLSQGEDHGLGYGITCTDRWGFYRVPLFATILISMSYAVIALYHSKTLLPVPLGTVAYVIFYQQHPSTWGPLTCELLGFDLLCVTVFLGYVAWLYCHRRSHTMHSLFELRATQEVKRSSTRAHGEALDPLVAAYTEGREKGIDVRASFEMGEAKAETVWGGEASSPPSSPPSSPVSGQAVEEKRSLEHARFMLDFRLGQLRCT